MENNKNQSKQVNMSILPGRGPGHGPGSFMKEKVKVKDSKGTLKRLWPYIAKQKFKLVFIVILVIATTLLGLLGPYLIAKAIDDYIVPKILKGLINVTLIMIGVQATSALLTWVQTYIMAEVSQLVVRDLRKDLFSNLQTLSLRYFDEKSNGEIMSRLTNDIENINSTLSQSITQLISSILSVVAVTIMMLLLSWQLAFVSMLTIPLIFIMTKGIAKYTRDKFRQQQMNLGSLNGMIEETLTAQRVVKVYCKEEETIKNFKKINEKLREASVKAQIFSGFMGPSMNLINNLSFAIIAGVGGYMAVEGLVSVGIIAAFLNYSKQFGRPLNQIANLYNTIQSAIAGAERVFETMDEKPDFIDKKNALELKEVKGNIEFKNVDFGYNKNVKVLKNANFTAKQGDTIALVGPTGAGKTTIINLLTRFYDIDSGEILIDKVNIKDIKKNSLRSKLGIVLQDTYLFSESVKENIRYGRLNATNEEVEKAAKLANAHHFITHLPQGYDTKLSEEGSNLSQGQRQLLAIARAILADPSILILDEATSSVDTRTEVHIQQAMLNLMKDRTSFVIAHRLSTIKEADMILVINNGEIIEKGTHESLIDNKGFYYKLYNSQFRKTAS
ncbi:ABC transporter ATP-binding protein [Clostridium grantii]|uniref:ATP-binding cassette, subfamily B n=1 Tax=Clostridium grantii DSM 8605 TaxID=1121316 RepID=A0A1M5VZ96_9CLOT|nr:ABC transporter ATP-binding protein [Clostridium grantii]SHH80575.1 ATP-binding cassette, subfamily B [Clostridium grantii DSM 8605]